MRVYRIMRDGQPEERFAATLADAHTRARNMLPHEAIYIDLLEVDSSQAAIVSYLNGETPDGLVPLRSWRITARGGLKEEKV